MWSGKIGGAAAHDRESSDLAAELIEEVCSFHEIDPLGIVLHIRTAEVGARNLDLVARQGAPEK